MIEGDKRSTLAALLMTAACRPHLEQATNPIVTNSGSPVGVLPACDFIAYPAAKAALNHAMLGLAHFFARKVRINTLLIVAVEPPDAPGAAALAAAVRARLEALPGIQAVGFAGRAVGVGAGRN